MDTGPQTRRGTGNNPAAAADAEQHARLEIAGLQGRLQRRARGLRRALAVAAGMVSGWLIMRWRRNE
jgi:hypothetical protein